MLNVDKKLIVLRWVFGLALVLTFQTLIAQDHGIPNETYSIKTADGNELECGGGVSEKKFEQGGISVCAKTPSEARDKYKELTKKSIKNLFPCVSKENCMGSDCELFIWEYIVPPTITHTIDLPDGRRKYTFRKYGAKLDMECGCTEKETSPPGKPAEKPKELECGAEAEEYKLHAPRHVICADSKTKAKEKFKKILERIAGTQYECKPSEACDLEHCDFSAEGKSNSLIWEPTGFHGKYVFKPSNSNQSCVEVACNCDEEESDDSSQSKSANFILNQPYPNPANDQLTIPLLLQAEHMELNITVYDLNGKRVIAEQLGNLPAGKHRVLLTTDKLHNGQYFYSIGNGKEILASNRFVIMH